ncbi:MAG: hypothetical protein AMJ53_15085, partial [Gammaproteobacteria bacterium SG8_11]
VDLTPANMQTWQNRLRHVDEILLAADDTSSYRHRLFLAAEEFPDIGEIVAWIFIEEDQGIRDKQ